MQSYQQWGDSAIPRPKEANEENKFQNPERRVVWKTPLDWRIYL